METPVSINDVLSVLMFASFIGLILTGFPVAWVLGGLSIVFTAIAIVLDVDLGFGPRPLHPRPALAASA